MKLIKREYRYLFRHIFQAVCAYIAYDAAKLNIFFFGVFFTLYSTLPAMQQAI